MLSHLLMAAATCLASLESQNEDSALATRGGKSLLGTFPFNAQAVDDLNLHESQNLNLHESQHLVENTAPALPASQALDARDARQVEITISKTLWWMARMDDGCKRCQTGGNHNLNNFIMDALLKNTISRGVMYFH